MTDSPKPNDPLDLKKQTEQARRVLMRLQWLIIVLLASGIVWLYISFESVVARVDNKLVIIDTVNNRLNTIDDRLFALTPTQNTNHTNEQATKEDSELFYIQLALADQLFRQGNFNDALTTLQITQWQLKQNNTLASPIKATLQESLKKDIAYISALKNQPDAWQAHIVKMRDVQSFLRNQPTSTTTTLNRADILLHDATMLLSLAIGSANVRDRNQMTAYLQEVRIQLEACIRLNSPNHTLPTLPTPESPETMPELKTLTDALYWINSLLANTPNNQNLQSTQILQTSDI